MFVTMTRSINKTTTQRSQWVSKRPIALWFQQSRMTLRQSSNTLISRVGCPHSNYNRLSLEWVSLVSCQNSFVWLFSVTVKPRRRLHCTNKRSKRQTPVSGSSIKEPKEWIALYFDRIAIILVKKSCCYPGALHRTNLWFLTHHSRLHRVCLWTRGTAASWFWRQWDIELLTQWDIEKSRSEILRQRGSEWLSTSVLHKKHRAESWEQWEVLWAPCRGGHPRGDEDCLLHAG